MCYCKLSKVDVVFAIIVFILFLCGFLSLFVPIIVAENEADTRTPTLPQYYYDEHYGAEGRTLWMAIGAPTFWAFCVFTGVVVWLSVRFCRTSSHSVFKQNAQAYAAYQADLRAVAGNAEPTIPVNVTETTTTTTTTFTSSPSLVV